MSGPEWEYGCGGTGYVHCYCGGDQCVCGADWSECPGCDECDYGDDEIPQDAEEGAVSFDEEPDHA